MTYRINPNHYIENGPTIAAEAAIARIRRAAFHAALKQREKTEPQDPLKQAA